VISKGYSKIVEDLRKIHWGKNWRTFEHAWHDFECVK